MNKPSIAYKLRNGDGKVIAEIVGCSYSLVEKVMRGALPIDNIPQRLQIIHVARQLVDNRERMKKMIADSE